MKAICMALGVARSNIHDRLKDPMPVKATRVDFESDLTLTKDLRELVRKRPSYGYRRATAVLNRRFRKEGKDLVNHKRIYRVMKENGLLLAKFSQKPTLTHDGKVATLASNMRWSSDCFVFKCWDGRKIEVAFVIDCCDREVIAWKATLGHINGQTIRDLMLDAVENRFQRPTLPRKIQWLSDNGPVYIAKETREFGELLGFEVCTTPSYSPESNGLSEALVKTYKRDYVYVNELWHAHEVLEKIGEWFDDYNENHPHKALKMLSPKEYIARLQEIPTSSGAAQETRNVPAPRENLEQRRGSRLQTESVARAVPASWVSTSVVSPGVWGKAPSI
jgi:putative transposase